MKLTYEKKIRYLDLAAHVATWSKDPSSKIGAVAVVGNGLPIIGYNGFPRGMLDNPVLLQHKESKYARIVHAEMNCIYNAAELGVSLRGATLFVSGLPVCSSCALGVIQAGIKHVVMRPHLLREDAGSKWKESFRLTSAFFMECEVTWEIAVSKPTGEEFLWEYDFRD